MRSEAANEVRRPHLLQISLLHISYSEPVWKSCASHLLPHFDLLGRLRTWSFVVQLMSSSELGDPTLVDRGEHHAGSAMSGCIECGQEKIVDDLA